MPDIFSRFVNRVFGEQIEALATERVNLAVRALDDATDRAFSSGGNAPRDRYSYQRADVLRDALLAWRENPLARRIVELTSQYVVGGGFGLSCDDEYTNEFLQDWWTNDLNRMPTRIFEWCDELTRSGELYVVLSTDAGGMSYLRAIPASEIEDIQTAPNDVEQEISFIQKPPTPSDERIPWPAYRANEDARVDGGAADGAFPAVMLHFFINRPVGAKFGESDLAPVLKWLTRYSGWLEDRVRLNRFRQAFIFVVYGRFKDAAQRLARQAELNANPPNPGSILVADTDSEKWDVIHPKLDTFEASLDGLALKKMIASGAGLPLHFLAEPESSTRTTAEESGGPTFKHFEQRQIYFRWMMETLARVAIRRRAMVDPRIRVDSVLKTHVADIYARDNAGLASAAQLIVTAFSDLRDRGLIDDAELLRLAYRFAGEVVDVAQLLKDGKAAPKSNPPQNGNKPAPKAKQIASQQE